MKAIESTATVKGDNELALDTPISIQKESRVRLIILLPDDGDIDENDWLHAGSSNPAFAFLNNSIMDVYSDTDGKPFNAEG